MYKMVITPLFFIIWTLNFFYCMDLKDQSTQPIWAWNVLWFYTKNPKGVRWCLLLICMPLLCLCMCVQRWHCNVRQELKFDDRPNKRTITVKTLFNNNNNGSEEIDEKEHTSTWSWTQLLWLRCSCNRRCK